jgi:streptogramin lyase
MATKSAASAPTDASLPSPEPEIRFGPDGQLYIADMSTHTIRRVDMKSGIISTFAGTGKPGFSGDGGPASNASFRDPIAIQFTPDGSALVICDIGNHRIRSVNLQSGTVTTLCGNGQKATTPDGAPFSPETPLLGPRTIDFDPRGNLWLALREGNAVFRVSGQPAKLEHMAGTGKQGFTGNDGPARAATLAGPKGLAAGPDGRIWIADTESHSIRVIDPATGLIRVAAGTGRKGPSQSADPLACTLARPHGVYIDRDGSLLIGDSENHVVRRLTTKP